MLVPDTGGLVSCGPTNPVARGPARVASPMPTGAAGRARSWVGDHPRWHPFPEGSRCGVAVRAHRATDQEASATMPVKLNQRAQAHARQLIQRGNVVLDQRDDWSEHRPSAGAENTFIEEHGFGE